MSQKSISLKKNSYVTDLSTLCTLKEELCLEVNMIDSLYYLIELVNIINGR